MKIQFLGTGAADWAGMDERGEKRGYASTLFDDRLLIDCTADAVQALGEQRVDNILITHSHLDHYEAGAVRALSPVALWGHESWVREAAAPGVQVRGLKIGAWTRIDRYRVLALPSNHTTERTYETPLEYVLDDGEKSILYRTDSCWPLTRSADIMQEMALRPLNAMIVDATVGAGHLKDFRLLQGHMCVEMVMWMRDIMVSTGRLRADAPVWLTHMARTLHPDAQTLEAGLRAPFAAARDGLTVTL